LAPQLAQNVNRLRPGFEQAAWHDPLIPAQEAVNFSIFADRIQTPTSS
jgi:hypothetical protein